MNHVTPNPKKTAGGLYRPLAIATLIASGLFQPLLPVLAAGTPAGTNISNTATATYKNDPAAIDTIEATSNTVTIEVAEIAGLAAEPSGFNDRDGGSVQAGDVLEYDFKVTNVGNADTNLSIPGVDDLITENFDVSAIEVYDSAGDLVGTISPGDNPQLLVGTGTDNLGFDPDGDTNTGFEADDFITIRVIGTPAAGTRANDPVRVILGNTGEDDNQPPTQNQPDDDDPINGDTTPLDVDLRTVNFGPETPENGQREASASQSIPFASSKTPVALAQIEKVAATAPGGTSDADDDLITYGLSLNVRDTSPNAAFDPQDLAGTEISVNGTTATHILVSDAIPVGTSLDAAAAPTGSWTPVYTASPTTTSALDADWRTDVNAATVGGPGNVTRIGFIFTANGTIAAGDTSPTLEFTVITDELDPAGGQVANIAQVFGTTDGDPDAEIVYDESGDSNPNNFNDDGTPPEETGPNADPNPTGTNYDPTTDDGIADPSQDGTDNRGDNTGTGPDGEATVVNSGVAAGADELSNGPSGDPAAVGPTDSNDDFTNVSTDVPAGLGTNDPIPSPNAVLVDNTVRNPATTGFVSNVTLEPIQPSQAEANDESAATGQYGANADIPEGTEVTIVYDDGTNLRTATYTYTAADGFELDRSTTDTTGTVVDPDDLAALSPDAVNAETPINIGNLAAGQSVDYQVIVQLPDADGTDDVTPLDEIPVPIVAFPDDDPENDGDNNDPSDDANGTRGFSGESTNNISINRVYTGYMELIKEARILDEGGTPVDNPNSTDPDEWSADFTNFEVQPGQFIEYRISYRNISSPLVGSGNVGLTAYEFQVIEDGNATDVNTVSGADNNWAAFTTHERNTVASRGSMQYFTDSTDFPGTVLTTSDPLTGTEVDVYRNNVGTVAPQVSGRFQFRRSVD